LLLRMLPVAFQEQILEIGRLNCAAGLFLG